MTLSSKASQTGPAGFGDMQPVFDRLSDGILIIRADRSIAYANPAFASLWRVPGELMDFHNDFALVNHVLSQLAEPAAFIHEVERLYASEEASADELAFKDGRVFSRRSVSLDNAGAAPARLWIFTDISDVRAPRDATPAADRKPGLFGGIFKH